MSLFDFFPTFAESPYSYIVVPIILVSSIIGFYHKPYFHALLLHPYEVYRGKRLYTLLTSAFVHRNWLHMLFNCCLVYGLAYDMYGNLKQENGVWHALSFTPLLCLLLIVIPNIVQTLFKRNDFLFTAVGASGLTFGLYGFGFLFFPLQRMSSFILPFIRNSLDYWFCVLGLFILLNFLPKSNVNRLLHIKSFLVGSLLALLFRFESIFEILMLFQK